MNPLKTKPQLVKDFWPRFKRGAIALIILLQLLILVAIAALLSYVGFFKENPIGFVVTLVTHSILGIVASLIIYRFVARPIKNLLAALVHISGEPSNIAPPNPNEVQFQKSGFKPVLQTVYQLASDVKDPIEEGESASTTSVRSTRKKATRLQPLPALPEKTAKQVRRQPQPILT